MFKFLHTCTLVPLLLGAFISANAQEVVENFQTWAMAGWKANPDSTLGTCESGSFVNAPQPNLTYKETYGNVSIDYTIVNGGVAPNCLPKGHYGTATSPAVAITPGVSAGYVSLNKNALADVTVEGGSLITSALPYIYSFDINLSGTSSARHATVSYSVDGGSTWTSVLDVSDVGKAGNVYTDNTVDTTNVMLKVSSYEQIVRVHDLSLYLTNPNAPTGIETRTWFQNGASISVRDHDVIVSNSPSDGSFQIVNVNGIVLAQENIKKGTEASFVIQKSGLYVLKFETNNQLLTKKVAIP